MKWILIYVWNTIGFLVFWSFMTDNYPYPLYLLFLFIGIVIILHIIQHLFKDMNIQGHSVFGWVAVAKTSWRRFLSDSHLIFFWRRQ
ncbi:hypothetical protein A3K64_00020 [Candidatus Micrarchaeota archaeon RBG_16_36_9]|nr:MAG: hypothetical protein A3K64_00020 [Candidatus Micrarchaeota archaeon RBG_16_36_9]